MPRDRSGGGSVPIEHFLEAKTTPARGDRAYKDLFCAIKQELEL